MNILFIGDIMGRCGRDAVFELLPEIKDEYNLTEKESIRLLARMLYPSYYFDEYFEYIKGNNNEEKLLNIIKRVDEYENYLYIIQNILSKNIDIPKINWI